MTSNAKLSDAEPVVTGGKRVLIVESQIVARVLLSECFRDVGFHVIEAANGDEALTLLAACKPDLLVGDERMSVSAGTDLFAKIRSLHPALPMIITSANAGSALAVTDGKVRWVTEPCTRYALVEYAENEIGLA